MRLRSIFSLVLALLMTPVMAFGASRGSGYSFPSSPALVTVSAGGTGVTVAAVPLGGRLTLTSGSPIATPLKTGLVTAASNATPISVTSTAHGLSTNDTIVIEHVAGNTAANASWTVTVVDANTFTLNTSVGNGAFSANGRWMQTKSTLYYTPFRGNNITLYDGANWVGYASAEISLALAGLTVDKNYDVFIYANAGVPTLELTAWTSDSARATALTTQDGVYVKTGVLTRRYVGMIRAITATTTTDNIYMRYVWNLENEVQTAGQCDSTRASSTYATATFRELNNAVTPNGTVRYRYIHGLAHSGFGGGYLVQTNSNASVSYVFLQLDGTDGSSYFAISQAQTTGGVPVYAIGQSAGSWTAAAGYHYITFVQYAAGATQTVNGVIGQLVMMQ